MTRSFVIRLLESFFRHRWLNLLPTILLVGAGIGYVFLKPREYTTQGLIYVPGTTYLATLTNLTTDPGSPWVTPAVGTTNEIKELLQTDTFIRSVVQKTDLAPRLTGTPVAVRQLIIDVRSAVWATAQGDNQVLVGSLYKNPVVAYQIASATIENYTQWRIDANLAQSSAAETFFTDLVQQYSAEVDTARQALNQYVLQHPAPLIGNRPDNEQIEIDRLKSDLDQAQTRYTTALGKQEDARLAASQTTVNTRQSLYVVDAPTIPDQPTTSLKQTALQSGLFVVVGFLLSIAAVVGGAILDRGFLHPLDVTVHLELPVLAIVPDTTPRRRRLARQANKVEVVVGATPALAPPRRYGSPEADPVRVLSAPKLDNDPSQPIEAAR